MILPNMVATTESVPRRRRREWPRRRLLDAALWRLRAQRLERATVDEIVRDVGFSKGAFYVHFEAKEDIFWAMLDQRRPLLRNLAMILRSIFTLNRKEPLWSALFMEFTAHASRDKKVRDQLAGVHRSWPNFGVEALNRGREAGLVHHDIDVEFSASVLIAVVEGTMMQSRLPPESFDLDATVEPPPRRP